MNLRDLSVDTKTTRVEYPGLKDFKVDLSAISRPLSRKLREESEITVMDKKHKIPVKELDEDTFIEKFAVAAIKGWSGLKYKYLEELMLVDLSKVEDVEACLDFNHENAVLLLKNSPAFDSWINDQVFDIERFRG